MNTLARHAFLALILYCACSPHLLTAALTDNKVYLPPNYTTLQPPAVGGSYSDPVFGSSIQRISNAPGTTNLDGGGNLIFITDEYSSMSPFNRDNSRILLVHQSYFALYDGSGRYLKTLPFEINASSEPRWSRSDANLLYYRVGNQLKLYNASTDARSIVRTFSEYSTVNGRGESDISLDGDHFVLVGDNRYVFVYQLSTNTKYPVLDTGGRAFDSVYITPANNVTISWIQTGTSRYTGIELFNRNMTFLRQVAHAGGHMDVTRDTNGDEVLIWTNSNDAWPIACNNGIVKIRLSDARQTCLLQLDWSLAVNISGPDSSGWVFVATYAPSDPLPGSAGWVPYTNEVLQVKLDGTETRRLLHHRSRAFNSYNYTPRPAVSRDGSRFIFSSNYSLQAILGYPKEYSDVYLVNVGGGSGGTSGSTSPSITTASLPDGTAGSSYSAALSASGGATPYSWSISSGALPAGLSLSASTGVVSGTPSGSGTSSFTAKVTDASGQTASKALSITIQASSTSGGGTGSSTARIQETASSVTYSGSWYPVSRTFFDGGAAAAAMDAGAAATVTFSGTGIRWIGYRDEWSGIARVYLDGSLAATIDTYSTPAQANSVIYSASGLPSGTHTLTISVLGQRNSSSAGAWVWIDGFDITTSTTSAAPTSGEPQAPTGLAARSGPKKGAINLSWTAAADATSATTYEVWRGSVSGGPYQYVGSVNSGKTSYENSGLSSGLHYYYVVRARNSAGVVSRYSNQASATVK